MKFPSLDSKYIMFCFSPKCHEIVKKLKNFHRLCRQRYPSLTLNYSCQMRIYDFSARRVLRKCDDSVKI
jgi:hypothetical protein